MSAWLSTMPVEGEKGAKAETPRLKGGRLAAGDTFEVINAVRRSPAPHALEDRQLLLSDGVRELAQPLVRDAALGAIGIEPVAAGNAEARLEAALGVMQPGVDHLAVARGRLGADPALLLQHQHLAPAARQRPRHPKPHPARADHHAFDGGDHRVCSTSSLSPT